MAEEAGVDRRHETTALLAKVWQRSLPVLHDRLALLEQAASNAASGALSQSLREEAAGTAHKLAGSLGMFGYADGTNIARQIEHLLAPPEPINAELLSQLTLALRQALPL